MRSKLHSQQWTVKRTPVYVDHEGISLPYFPILAEDNIPVLYSRTLSSGCFAALMPDMNSLLWDIIKLCNEDKDANLLLNQISDRCSDMLGTVRKSYSYQLGAERRKKPTSLEDTAS